MSYCVNCGVRLSKSEHVCPLCNTKVINPNKLEEDYIPAYASQIEKFKTINYKFISKLIILILISLAAITVFCDLIITKEISWSIYVIASSLVLASHFIFFFNKNIYLSFTTILITTELLLFVIAYLNNGIHWYIYLVLPYIFIFWCYIMICTRIIKKRRKGIIRRVALCFLFSSIALITIETGIDLYNNNLQLKWSLYAALPITIISILLFLISFNRKLIEEIKQRIFIYYSKHFLL